MKIGSFLFQEYGSISNLVYFYALNYNINFVKHLLSYLNVG